MIVDQCYTRATKSLNGRLIAPYQRQGVTWMLGREKSQKTGPKGGFLCDEMGLGKTVQIISTLLGNPKPKTLIIVPKSIVSQWVEQFGVFAPSLKVGTYDGPGRTKDQRDFDQHDIIIAPYSVTRNRDGTPTTLHKLRWDRVVLDEAHEIRNPKSKTNISICAIQSDIRWLVTGTPVFNSIKDFIGLCKFLGISKQVVQADMKRIRESYILRRTKEDVARFNERLKLPPCDFQNIELEMAPEEKILYEKVFNENQEIVREIFTKSTNISMHSMHILECLLRQRQLMVHPQLYINGVAKKIDEIPEEWEHDVSKFEKLFEMIQEHSSEKTLIFCQFVGEMNLIQDRLRELDIQSSRIDGSIDKEGRERQIKKFKEGPTNSVFIIQIKAGGQGLNLQEATRVYIMAPSWNPATELQAIGRSHRTGQTNKVVVRRFIYVGTETTPSVEQSMMELQGHKSIVCSEVLNDPRLLQQVPTKSVRNITIQDLKKIFQV